MQAGQSYEGYSKTKLQPITEVANLSFGNATMRFESLFFWLAPFAGFSLFICVALYGLATGNDFFTLHQLKVIGFALNFSFYSLVTFLWFFILDGTHLFHSLARVFLIPAIFRAHHKALCFSFLFFALGPVAVLFPYMAKLAWQIEPQTSLADFVDFFPTLLLCCYFIWAYLHVTQQHWGFATLKLKHFQALQLCNFESRRDHAPQSPDMARLLKTLKWYSLFCTPLAPVAFFVLDGHVLLTGNSRLAMAPRLVGLGLSACQVVVTLFACFACATLFCVISLKRHSNSFGLSPFSLLCASSLLHLSVMSLPPLALFVHPIITVGHDLQYHALCLLDGRSRAGRCPGVLQQQAVLPGWREALFTRLYSNSFLIGAVCLVFAVLSTSPFFWAETLEPLLSLLPFPLPEASTERVFAAGNHFVQEAPLEYRLVSAFCIGFAAQHYYLDGKIWKLSQDKGVKDELNRALFRVG